MYTHEKCGEVKKSAIDKINEFQCEYSESGTFRCFTALHCSFICLCNTPVSALADF